MAERGVVGAILRGYADPRASMARQVEAGLSEPRALAHLMLACGLGFLASLPNALRISPEIAAEAPVAGAVAAHLFGYLLVAPLLLYAVAAAVHLGARAFGGRGGFLAARSALFWSLVLGAPIALALALVGVVAQATAGTAGLPIVAPLRYAGMALWLWLFAACLAEAEGFRRSGAVAVAMFSAFAALAAATAMLAGRLAPA